MQLETERDDLISSMNSADYYTKHSAQEIKEQTEKLQTLETQINQGYQRWEELENKRALSESSK